jgi:hypothetical protein
VGKTLFFIGGAFNALLVAFHLSFWKIFDWPASLAVLSAENRSIMQVLNIHLALAVALFAWVSFFHWRELTSTRLGRTLAISIAVFYYLRAINQVIFWGVEDAGSMVATVVLVLIGVLYTVPLLNRSVRTSES